MYTMYVYIYCRLTIVAINWTFISFCWWYVAFFVLDFFYFICLVKCYIYLWCWVRYSTTAFHLSNVVLKFDFDFSLKLLSKCFIVMFHHDLPVTYDTDWVQKARPIYNYLNVRRSPVSSFYLHVDTPGKFKSFVIAKLWWK